MNGLLSVMRNLACFNEIRKTQQRATGLYIKFFVRDIKKKKNRIAVFNPTEKYFFNYCSSIEM